MDYKFLTDEYSVFKLMLIAVILNAVVYGDILKPIKEITQIVQKALSKIHNRYSKK